MRGRLEDAEAYSKEGLLGMPAIRSPFGTNQDDPVEVTDQILLPRMETRSIASLILPPPLVGRRN